jgi:hypothetical protein
MSVFFLGKQAPTVAVDGEKIDHWWVPAMTADEIYFTMAIYIRINYCSNPLEGGNPH